MFLVEAASFLYDFSHLQRQSFLECKSFTCNARSQLRSAMSVVKGLHFKPCCYH